MNYKKKNLDQWLAEQKEAAKKRQADFRNFLAQKRPSQKRLSEKTIEDYLKDFEHWMQIHLDGTLNTYIQSSLPDDSPILPDEEKLIDKHPYLMTPEEFLRAYPDLKNKIDQDDKQMRNNREEKGGDGKVGHANCKHAPEHYKKFMESLLLSP